MRVISKFKDYYDGCRAWRDEGLVYVREMKTIEWRKLDNRAREKLSPLTKARAALPNMSYRSNVVTTAVIGFCGKVYPVMYANTHFNNELSVEGKATYDSKSFEAELRKLKGKRDTWERHYNEAIRLLGRNTTTKYRGEFEFTHLGWSKFTENFNNDIGDDIFVHLSAPVVLLTEHDLVINPCLKDYSFMTQLDPYTAYQELSMYVGNNLATQMDPNIDRTQDLIRDQKGFDKWSFRKVGKKGM